MSLRDWVAEQLADPTKLLHGVGVVGIAVEFVKHWVWKTPVDMNVIYTSFGCIGSAIVQDRVNTPPIQQKP